MRNQRTEEIKARTDKSLEKSKENSLFCE